MMYLKRVGDKLVGKNSGRLINAFNIQRLLLTAVMIASKYLDDLFCSNKQWALIGDISTKEINALELRLLSQLGFTVAVTKEDYLQEFHDLLRGTSACHTGFTKPRRSSTSPNVVHPFEASTWCVFRFSILNDGQEGEAGVSRNAALTPAQVFAQRAGSRAHDDAMICKGTTAPSVSTQGSLPTRRQLYFDLSHARTQPGYTRRGEAVVGTSPTMPDVLVHNR